MDTVNVLWVAVGMIVLTLWLANTLANRLMDKINADIYAYAEEHRK